MPAKHIPLLSVLALSFLSQRVEASSQTTLPTYEEMTEILEQITVHEHELIPGEYEAPEFAKDFQDACTNLGIYCMRLFFGSEGLREHVANVIEVDYEYSTIVRRFCLIEPQDNTVVACWLDDEISDEKLPLMTWVEIHQVYPWFSENLAQSGGEYFFYVDSDRPPES